MKCIENTVTRLGAATAQGGKMNVDVNIPPVLWWQTKGAIVGLSHLQNTNKGVKRA